MAIEESQSQVASPIRLGPAVCEKDAKALQFIDEMTMNTDAVQEWVLEEILSQNAETEYLRPYQLDGATDRDTFKSKTPNETWDCIVCGKHFCKKKSLGGHMNRHPERPWRGLYPPPTGHHAPEACVVCGKRFVSKKALGGHMKQHPQRSWRGLLPPTGEPAAARNGNTTVPLQIDLNQPAPSQIDLNQPASSQIDLNQPAPEE